MATPRKKLWAAYGLAAATLALSIALLICFEAPDSLPAHALAAIVPAPDVPAADYQAHLERAGQASDGERKALLAQAEADVWRELHLAPAKADAWAQLVYVSALRHGAAAPEPLRALRSSYVVAPLDPNIALWRIHFGFEVWNRLRPDLRGAVLTELNTMWRLGPDAQAKLAQTVQTVDDPAGLAAGELALVRLGWTGLPSK